MYLDNPDWRRVVELAPNYLAIGNTDVYLSHSDDDYPWEWVTSCEPGGSHRLDIATSVTFRAEHPCGLTFRWSFDLEPRSANGSGSYQIDTSGIARVLAKLPAQGAKDFRAYLLSCVEPVEKRGREYDAAAREQFGMAQQLRAAAESGVERVATRG